jgi:regulator of sigma E protease|uniref:Zinc metalloprotease n=1 Tax=Desulfobacca acetoxidans TaxID=60893 RepID=A0A7C3WRC8_9BACT
MITIVATIVVLGILIFVHEFGHFLLAKLLKVRVEAFSLGFPPKLLSKKIGETEYRLSVIPLGGYVKLLGENPDEQVPPELQPRSFSHHPLWHRTLIVLAGPGFNLLFCVLALFLMFSISGIPFIPTTIGSIKADSPAAQAGLQPGDKILAVQGKKVDRWEELSYQIRQQGERPIVVTVKRGERIFEVTVTPQRMETTNVFGQKVSAVLIGVGAGDNLEVEQVGIFKAFAEGTVYTYRLVVLTVMSIYKLLIQEIPVTTLGGPILIAQVAGKQAEQGLAYLIHFMAILSVNLALLNLLPIPILDGGHLIFILWEAIRGKPMAVKHREMAQALGLMLILALMVLVFYQDIMRLFSPQH